MGTVEASIFGLVLWLLAVYLLGGFVFFQRRWGTFDEQFVLWVWSPVSLLTESWVRISPPKRSSTKTNASPSTSN